MAAFSMPKFLSRIHLALLSEFLRRVKDDPSDLVWSHVDPAWTSFLKVHGRPSSCTLISLVCYIRSRTIPPMTYPRSWRWERIPVLRTG